MTFTNEIEIFEIFISLVGNGRFNEQWMEVKSSEGHMERKS